jgi:hypothetical protein
MVAVMGSSPPLRRYQEAPMYVQIALVEQASDWIERLLEVETRDDQLDPAEAFEGDPEMAFRIGQRIQLSIRNARTETPPRVMLPGVIVDGPHISTRPGTSILQNAWTIVTLREAADGRTYLRESTEAEPFVLPRPTNNVVALDVDPDGTFLSVRQIANQAKADLQSYLTGIPVPALAAQQPEPTDAPLI